MEEMVVMTHYRCRRAASMKHSTPMMHSSEPNLKTRLEATRSLGVVKDLVRNKTPIAIAKDLKVEPTRG
jgi:hypothetical protein